VQAWILEEIGQLHQKETKLPKLHRGEALVSLSAVGICGSDLPRIYKDGAHRMPLIPGHEFSGTVVAVHTEGDSAWIGKQVGIYPLIPCRSCIACKQETYELCRSYRYLGSREDGGFAEYVKVPLENLIALPKQVTAQQGAMLEPMAVAVHAMRQMKWEQTEPIVVCGLGTIGLLLVMFLLDRGANNILAIGNHPHQLAKAKELGLSKEQLCDASKESVTEWVQARTFGQGAACFFECVGANRTIYQAIQCTMPSGRICLVGNPKADIHFDKQTYWKILRNQIEVKGSWNSTFFSKVGEQSDWEYVLERLQTGRITPEKLISHRFSFTQLKDALEMMYHKEEAYAKVMICFENK
jgi:L-iditol 2-dehydrogenase